MLLVGHAFCRSLGRAVVYILIMHGSFVTPFSLLEIRRFLPRTDRFTQRIELRFLGRYSYN